MRVNGLCNNETQVNKREREGERELEKEQCVLIESMYIKIGG